MLDNNSSFGFSRQLGLFFCLWLFGFAITILIIGVVTAKFGTESRSVLYVTTIIQDILVFLSPVATASVLISRKPIRLLQLAYKVDVKSIILVGLVAVASIPVMNIIIEWNAGMSLPESLHSVEDWMRQSEQQSAALINKMLEGTSFVDLIVGILIIGILTGLSEEVFFRGMLQKLFMNRPMNPHLAIWITAIIFSAVHMQFYGFVPRLLLGAFFGYLAWWGHSLWLPIIAHALNNSLVVISQWLINNNHIPYDINEIGVGDTASDFTFVSISIVLTAFCVILLYRNRYISQTSCG